MLFKWRLGFSFLNLLIDVMVCSYYHAFMLCDSKFVFLSKTAVNLVYFAKKNAINVFAVLLFEIDYSIK